MTNKNNILRLVEAAINKNAPGATVILFGSGARGDDTKDSDLDILILLNKDKITRKDEKSVKYPLYDIEFETGQIISPLVFSKKEWETKHSRTPFYENISKEGKIIYPPNEQTRQGRARYIPDI